MTAEAGEKVDGSPATCPEAPEKDRRRSPRFRLRDARAFMSFPAEAGLADCEVLVLDISGGGAALLADVAPSAGQSLRLRLPGGSGLMEPVDAVVVSTSCDPAGNRVVRLRFAQWIPLDPILGRYRERRLWERYPARESRASLLWLQGTTEAVAHGNLLNVSGGGVAFIGDVTPPPDVPIWLQLDAAAEQAVPIDPVEARLVGTSVDPSGMTVAHLQFVTPCPMTLFELAVNGSG